MAIATVVAIVVGVAGVWIYRLRVVVSVMATIVLTAVGAALLAGAVLTLQSYLTGGFNNIGTTLLLVVAGFISVPATALTAALAVLYIRERSHASA